MGKDKLQDLMDQLQVLIDKLGETINQRPTQQLSRKLKPKNKLPSSVRTLPDYILQLRSRGFFKQTKTAKEVHAGLQSTYSCSPDRVVMALLRLQRKKELRKTSKIIGKKKQVGYVW